MPHGEMLLEAWDSYRRDVRAAQLSARAPDLMKKCTRCKEFLPGENFSQKQSRCRSCNTVMATGWRKANPEKARAYARGYRATWKANNPVKTKLYAARGKARERGHAPPEAPSRPMPDSCEICGRTESSLRLDHCHESGRFRGWLCNKCNLAIGLFDDRTASLQEAAEYLRRAATR